MQPSLPQIDPVISEHLESLRGMPPRDSQAAARGRAAFLAQAEIYAQAVSRPRKQRLRYWNFNSKNLFQRKERFSMFTTLVSIFAVLAMTLGGAGATVYAAQGSLPGEALYQVKIQSEDIRLTWEEGETEQIELALQFANRRIQEIQTMLAKDQTPPESLMIRLQNQIDTALRLASGLDEDRLAPALQRIRQTLEQQEQTLARFQESGGLQNEAILAQVRDRIQLRLSWVEEGQTDPFSFRARFGPGGNEDFPAVLTLTTGDGFGPGPFVTGTPTPGTGYGPGPGPQATCTCTPQSGQGPQPTPGPGKGTGPGPQPSSTCTPQAGAGPQLTPGAGDGAGPGPQPAPGEDNTSPGPQPTSEPQDGAGPGPQPTDPGNGSGGPGSGNRP
jgi:hypothetical protein